MRDSAVRMFALGVEIEVARARSIHGPFPVNVFEAFNVLTEEYGEVSRELNGAVANGDYEDWLNVLEECKHLAAMAARFAVEIVGKKLKEFENGEG